MANGIDTSTSTSIAQGPTIRITRFRTSMGICCCCCCWFNTSCFINFIQAKFMAALFDSNWTHTSWKVVGPSAHINVIFWCVGSTCKQTVQIVLNVVGNIALIRTSWCTEDAWNTHCIHPERESSWNDGRKSIFHSIKWPSNTQS